MCITYMPKPFCCIRLTAFLCVETYRLKKDLAEVRLQFPMLNIDMGGNSSSVNVVVPLTVGTIKFIVVVPKYYPHVKPTIRLIDHVCFCSPFIDGEGQVFHDDLSNWTALGSLVTVINLLQNVCATITLRNSTLYNER